MQHINFVKLAQQAHNLQVYNNLCQLMSNYDTLKYVFNSEIDKSHKLLFVAAQILAKKLQKREIMPTVGELEQSPQMATNLQSKRLDLFVISNKLYGIIMGAARSNIPQYIIRTCINTISACINATINSNPYFQTIFISYFQMLVPDFQPNQLALRSGSQNRVYFIEPNREPLGFHHEYAIQILISLLDYVLNSTYFRNYYCYRRNMYVFKNNYLPYLLQYSIFCFKTIFKINVNPSTDIQIIYRSIRPTLKLLENIVVYPFSLHMHQAQIQDQIHQNISGLHSEIYFPTFFRTLLCDTNLLMDIIGYYSKLNIQSFTFEPIREDIYSLIRIVGRILSSAQYIFADQNEKKGFRSIGVNFVTRILKENKFYDSYLIMCISKINIKFMSIENEDEIFQGKKQYFKALGNFICQGLYQCQGKIQDGDKHPYRQLFQVLTAYINIGANTILDEQSKQCAQQALNILLKQRFMNNADNDKIMKEFGFNNFQEVDCFDQIFARVPEIFKINLQLNLTILDELDLNSLSNASLTFWLHFTALSLLDHDTSLEQTHLIIKFLEAAIKVRSIASLHFIQILIKQLLYQIKDGIPTTYLWQFISLASGVNFQNFIIDIIKYAMEILTIPNYTLIQNCLSLFKVMFTKLCKNKHRSFIIYFEIIEQVCKQIDKTMLIRPQYIKLRIGFFSVISIIWINGGQPSLAYRIFKNIRLNMNEQSDFIQFLRYMTDITGLLEPIQLPDIFKMLLELVLQDMKILLPFYLGTPQKLKIAFGQEIFLKTFIKFVYTLINDNELRLTFETHTQLPLQVQQIFRPYLIEVLNYDFPKITIQAWIKFMKLNPLGKLLPINESFKTKNSPQYKNLLFYYFQNLHRLDTIEEFSYVYTFIGDNIDLMSDWWDEIISRGLKPNINVGQVVKARIWNSSRQKQQFSRLLFRIGKYDERYWKVGPNIHTQTMYSEWFLANCH